MSRSAEGATTEVRRRALLRGMGMFAGAMIATAALMAGCSANGVTGPSGPDAGSSISPVTSSSRTVGTGVVTSLVATKTEEDELTAAANPDFTTSTETVFPVTETVINTCYNDETPVLNGWLKVREKITMNDLTFQYQQNTWKDTRGVYATAQTYWDDDKDPSTPPKPIMVRYRNRTSTLDKFVVGPASLPFASDQMSVMYLERLSPEHGMKYGKYDDREDDDDDREYRHGPGDDLFVYARQRVVVGADGVVREKIEYRTECK